MTDVLDPAGDQIIRTPEVAAMTGAPIGTVRYWQHIGKGPASFKLGGRRVYRRSAVLQWIAEQERAAGGQR